VKESLFNFPSASVIAKALVSALMWPDVRMLLKLLMLLILWDSEIDSRYTVVFIAKPYSYAACKSGRG
jgi:hypothetical protein